jgi:Chitobiase/beta-hexosaminidase C-terminal domain/Bacterial lectin
MWQQLFGTGLLAVVCILSVHAQVNVTTQRNDISRTGQNLNETILNTSNVNSTQFGALFSQPVDGFVYAQPLYLSNVTIGGQSHNVLFVATEHDSVYAFDANTNGGSNSNPLWYASMLSTAHGAAPGALTVSSEYVGTDIIPEVGITGTPVIDPASGTLYVVSATQEGSNFILRLHALDVTSGAEKFGGPVAISGSVPGTGNGSTSGTLLFDPEWQNQRPGLLMLNGIIYIGFASHGDGGPWHGWIFGYNAATLQQTGIFCTSPNGVGAGVWMGGGGLAAEVNDPVNHPYGRMLIPTGNGDYTATMPYGTNMDYGDSILDLDLTNGAPTIQDEFTPEGQANLDAYDGDQASGGLMILPVQTSGPYPNLLVQAGKSGEVYLLNRNNLGGYNPAGDQVVQELPFSVGNVGAWTTPAYWNGTVYYWGVYDTLKAFPLVNGRLTGPTAVSTETYGYPGANPSISANGTTNGIVWTIETDAYTNNGPAVLEAHDAVNPGTTLYSSNTNLARDNPGNAVKFAVPTVANGMVYVGTQDQVTFYGQVNGEQVAAYPFLNPGSETFSGNLTVSMTDPTPGAIIYYTLDGSTPTSASAVYTAPITVNASTTIQAIASAPGYLQSEVASGVYVDSLQTSTPTFSPGSGIFTGPVSVTISDTTPGAIIYYTTDGSTPTTSSMQYTGLVSVTGDETIKALAVAPGFINSAVGSAAYTLEVGQTGINFPVGFAGTQGIMILNGSTDLDDSRLQLTNGVLNEAGSAWYFQPESIQAFTTSFSFQLSNPAGNGITFAIQGNNTSSVGTDASGLGYQGIGNSVAVKFDFATSVGLGTDSTGLFTNGAAPTIPAIDLSSTGINLQSDDPMTVQLAYNGTTLSMVITDQVTGGAYSTSWPVNIPSIVGGNTAYIGFTGGTGTGSSSQKILNWTYSTGSSALPVTTSPIFSPPGGNYGTAQQVSITSGSAGAAIYYTTDGTTPTTASRVYSGPVTVNATETLKAIAVASGYSPSAVGTATYSIGPILPAPTFSPSQGTYTTAQSVTISDGTAGVNIYYTTDGSTPTTSSNVYSAPITVSKNETIQAVASGTGYNNSPVAAAAYAIAPVLAAPTFSPAGGTFTAPKTVTISDATPGATIYFTTNGTTPTTSSTIYIGPINVSWSQTLQAIAVETGFSSSPAATASYTINTVGTTYVNYPNDGFTAANLSLQGYGTVTGGMLQLTNGGGGEETGVWFNTKLPVQNFVTDFTFQQLSALADGMTFTIQNDNIWAVGYAGGGLGYQSIPNSVAVKFDLYSNSGEGSDSTGLYTNGSSPTVPSVDLSSTGINLHSGDLMHAHMVYDGTNLTMTLTDTVTNATVTEVFPVNIPSVVGSNTAWVGFTGGTGGSSSTQDVESWTYVVPSVVAAAVPTFSPAGGPYTTAQTVTISDATAGATIYYTTNGTTPTTSSSVYSSPITVSTSETLEAIAAETGYTNSAAGTAAYTIGATLPAPTISPAGGTYTASQSVTLSDATAGTTIYYTTNGTTPTTSSSVYSGAITVSASETLKAIAMETGYLNSPMASAAYTIVPILPTPTFAPGAGTYSTSQTVTISDATPGTTIYYTTNGTTPTTSSSVYSGAITVSASETLEAIGVETGYTNSAVATASYTISSILPAPTFSPAAGTYTASQSVTISDATVGTTIYYTTNGTTPTTSSSVYSGAITVSASETLEAIAVESGSANSPVASAAYIINSTLPAPTFSPSGGTYSTSQSVTISDATPGTTIYYTTNGTTPTTSSAVYSGAITVGTSETLEAMAIETGHTNSPVGSASYTIGTGGGTTYVNYPNNGFTATNLSVQGYGAVTGGMLQLTNGGSGEESGVWFNTKLPVQSFVTDFTFQQLNAVADGMTFTIQNDNIWAVGDAGGGLGYQDIPDSVAVKFDIYNNSGEGADSTGLYTNGASPTVPAIDLTSTGIVLSSGDLMHAHMVYDGTNLTMTLTDTVTNATATEVFPVNIPSIVGSSTAWVGFTGGTGGGTATQNVLSWTYVSPAGTVASTPTFSPVGGTYSVPQTVTISDSTPNATIYYTTNGTTPTTSSSVYSSPITVSASETVEAIATASGDSNSATGTAVYTIAPALPVPTFSPAAGTYTASQSVTISDTTAGTTIYYTTNGTTPTTSSTKYTGAISVSASETVEAIAVETGYTSSPVATAAYTITPVLPAPAFSPGAGTYTSSQAVTISDSTAGTTIYYTTNGTTPTTSSSVYSGPITVSASETLEALAVETAYTNSPVGSAAYTIAPILPTPTFTPVAGTYSTSQSVTISDSTAGTTIYYTTNGTTPTTSSSLYGGPITVSASETIKAIAVETGFTNSTVATAVYTISSTLPAPTFLPAAGTYTTSQSVTISDSTAGTTIYYTTNGTTPTTSSGVYSGAITVSANETLEAMAIETGYTNSVVASAAYIIAPVLPTPTFSPAAGTYTASQSVTISDTTSGTTIYYTTNGTTPTTSSTKYSGAITVSASETLKAIAVETGFTNSAVATAAYTIAPVLPAPTFSPVAGSYTTAQTVTISDTTTGTTIYYTTNGTTPTTSSSVYSTPITVSVSEKVEAIAVKTAFTNSPVATATYTITPILPAPTFSPVAGSYTTSQTVTISDATAGTTIYYTTNGTTPTTSSSVYSSPITVSASETLEAMATETGYTSSSVGSAVYTIAPPALPAPTYSPVGGTYTTSQTVTISDATPGTTIYYTTNGTTPTTSSSVYTSPITVSTSETLEAIATETGYSASPVATAPYTISSGSTTYVNYSNDGFTATNLSVQGYGAVTGGMLQLTNGGSGEESGVWFNTKLPVQNFVTDFTFQQLNASADGMTFTIQNDNIWAVGDAGGGLGSQDIPNSVSVKFDIYNNAGEGNDSTGLYTNGAAPTVPAIDLTPTGIVLLSGDLMHAHMVYDGTNLTMTLTDTVTNATATEVFPVNIPSVVGSSTAWVGFTGGTGGFSATQNVLSWSYSSQ